MFASSTNPVMRLQESVTTENIFPSPPDEDTQQSSSSSSDRHSSLPEVLSNHRQLIFDKALGQMFTRHFCLVQHEFPSADRFEGWVYTYNRHQYRVIISYTFSCSCRKFRRNSVCKHFLFVLKRFFHVNLYSSDLRLSILQYRQFTAEDLEQIFQGQLRRLCPIVTPEAEQLPFTFKRQSIEYNDVCPICFERLLLPNRRLVTCFHSCGKSIHKSCMNEWKRVRGDATNCPLCQARWTKPSATERAVLEHYQRRSNPSDWHEKYILCCLYTPPDCF